MAIYHLTVKTGSRGGGQSARAKSDYIAREGKYAPDADELEHVEHGHMPAWAQDDPRAYWTAADENERANGSLFKDVEFALPKELSADERRALAVDFAAQLTDAEKLPYTLAVHRGDGENPHAHLMMSERANGRHRAQPRTVVQAREHGRARERRGQKIADHDGQGMAAPGPREVGADGEPGTRTGWP